MAQSLQKRIDLLGLQVNEVMSYPVPEKPMNWTEKEYKAIVVGLGLLNRPFETFGLGRFFQIKYKNAIEQILREFTQGKFPSDVIEQAEPLEFTDIQAIGKQLYFYYGEQPL